MSRADLRFALLNLLPAGSATWVPDFLALALGFWNVHLPRRGGIGAAFAAGLLMDVHDGALFGVHALAYTLLAYGAITLHRRMLWFPPGAQALHLLALLLVAQFVSLAVRLWVGGGFPAWTYVLSSVFGALGARIRCFPGTPSIGSMPRGWTPSSSPTRSA